MKKFNLEEVEVREEGLTLEPGQYLCEIIRVEDVPEKEYLKIGFDIIDGEFKNFISLIHARTGKWPNMGILYKSYKQSALSYFKRFIVAVEKSNADYSFNFDEQTLLHKKFVGNFGIEEWLTDEGEVRESVKLDEARSVESWKAGKIKTPQPKRLSEEIKEETKSELSVEEIKKLEDSLPF